jgi:hypothetical protein
MSCKNLLLYLCRIRRGWLYHTKSNQWFTQTSVEDQSFNNGSYKNRKRTTQQIKVWLRFDSIEWKTIQLMGAPPVPTEELS